MELSLQRLERREWWLWFCALVVTILSWAILFLTAFPSLFRSSGHFWEIRSEQARWGTLSLLLLFNTWLVYRQRLFRRQRRQLTDVDGEATGQSAYDPSRLDAVTGLHTRASSEHLLGKEIARARRNNTPLSLVAVHLDDFANFDQLHGNSAGDSAVKEFASRLKKASRGCDFAVQLNRDDFLLVLPECSLTDAKIVVDRVGTLQVKCSGQDVTVTYSVGWVDYKRGDVPSDLFKRAGDILRLYRQASNAGGATLLLR
ncbi:MAG TPA: diguanylate cyclase [Terriglobales bacterium]|nr:diguanylate cyclase [Terriglobales bacterium]